MKLIIQIPCFNEGKTLEETVADLPTEIDGLSAVEYLVIDDGSSDDTYAKAVDLGVHHIVRHPANLGLARAFMTGLETSIEKGADVIVNTDADNQYSGADIPKLVQPILKGTSEIVVGARPIEDIQEFSTIKKMFQRLGSSVVRKASRTEIEDAPSGFRAFTRDAAMQINVFGDYTYTLETLIQAGQKGIVVTNVPISVNAQTRPSRLVKNIFSYIHKSMITIIRIYILYRPLRFFMNMGSLLIILGSLIGFRFLYYYFFLEGSGKIQSLLLAVLLIGVGMATCLAGLLADLIASNRKLMEKIKYQALKREYANKKD